MKADGSIIIDTKIVDGGMEKGFELIKDEMSSVGITAKKVGEQIELSFSKMDVSKPIEEAVASVQTLAREFSRIDLDYRKELTLAEKMEAELDKVKQIMANAEREYTAPDAFLDAYSRENELSAAVEKQKDVVQSLEKQWKSVNASLEASQKRLTTVLNKEIQKQAAAEEKASQKAIKAAEKEAAAKQRSSEKQIRDLAKPVRRLNSRLREIVSGALVFNVISAGLRNLTSYFGSALAANKEYTSSLSALRGSLMTAFQPIYESILPAISTLISWLNTAVQVIGRFFAALAGKNYTQMVKNAEALNNQAGAIGGVGDAAEEAAKQLAGFDEINRLESVKNAASGGGGGGLSSVFEEIEIPSSWETAIESLAMRIKDIFFDWDNLTPEIIAEKLVTGLSIITGGLIGFALGGPHGALIGMTIGAGLGVVLSNVIFNGDGALTSDEFLAALVAGLLTIGGAVVGFAVGGPGGTLLGATIGLGLTFTILNATFDDVEKNYDELADKIIEWSDRAARTTETGFIIPTGEEMLALSEKIKGYFSGASDDIIANFDRAARTTETGFVIPTEQEFAAAAEWIQQKLSEAKDGIENTWVSLPNWFAQNVTQPIADFFNGLSDAVSRTWDNIVESVVEAVKDIVSAFGSIFGQINSYQTTGSIPAVPYAVPASMAAYSLTPEIPYLAKGAVIPPNRKFMAVLGDQTSGTNIEAPLETIKQALAEVMAEYGGGDISINFTGDLAQLARILYPEIHRQDRNTARARGW